MADFVFLYLFRIEMTLNKATPGDVYSIMLNGTPEHEFFIF